MIIRDLGKKGKQVLCRCDFCGKEVIKYKSQLTNQLVQFCNMKCSTSAKRKGEVIDVQVRQLNKNLRGVEHHLMCKDVKRKRDLTNLHRYGVSNQFERSDIIKKISVIVENRTTEEWTLIQQKSEQTCLERYGVKHVAQVLSIHERQFSNSRSSHKRGHIETPWGIFWYRSSWELQFLEWCVTHVADVKPNVSIPYEFDGKHHIYFADFLVTSNDGILLLCEIKPDQLAILPQNQAKLLAGNRWCEAHQAKFVLVNKDALLDLSAALGIK